MGWDDLRLQTAAGDETAAFGVRQETGSAFYRVETRCTLEPTQADEVTAFPEWQAAATTNNICVALDQTVHVLDTSCSEVLASLDLDCAIDKVAWGGDTAFLVIADRNGTIHLVDTVTNAVLFSQAVVKATADSKAFATLAFRKSGAGQVYEFLVVSSQGKVFSFKNIDLPTLRDAIDHGDMSQVQAVKGGIQMSTFDIASSSGPLTGACAIPLGNEERIITWGSFGLEVWSNDGGQDFVRLDEARGTTASGGITKCVHVVLQQQHHLLVMDDTLRLSIWHLDSLMLVRRCASEFQAWHLLPKAEDSSERKVVALVRDVGTQACQLKIINLTKFEEEYGLSVAERSLLMPTSDPESISILELRNTANTNTLAAPIQPAAASLLVRCLEPSQPTNRFYTLLHKQRFDDAQQLARQFGLDEKLVYEVRVNHLLDQLDQQPDDNTLELLQAALADVDDAKFVVDSCLNASFASIAGTMTVLEYAETRMAQLAAQDSEGQALRSRLLCALKRLGTFKMALAKPFDPVEWHRFRQADMLNELVSCLHRGKMGVAATIWSRHESEYELIENATAILPALPDSLSSKRFIPWLQHQVLPRMHRQDHVFALDWIFGRACSMELTEKATWPQCSLDLLKAADVILVAYTDAQGDSTEISKLIPDIHSTHPRDIADRLCGRQVAAGGSSASRDPALDAAKDIGKLRLQLIDIQFLMEHAALPLSLAEYQLESPESILFALLERVAAADLLPDVVESEVKPYAARHGCDVADVLLKYIKALSTGAQSVAVTGSTWSSRALGVIACLHTIEAKAKATLILMSSVSVPCHREVDELIEQARGWQHSQKKAFDEQYRILNLKKMMLPYGITSFNMSNAALARGLMRRILANLDVPTAFADALQVVDAYHHLTKHEAYCHRIRVLALAEQLTAAVSLFASLPASLMASVGLELAAWAKETCAASLATPGEVATAIQLGSQITDVMLRVAAAANNALGELAAADLADLGKVHDAFRATAALQAEFGVTISPHTLSQAEEQQACLISLLEGLEVPKLTTLDPVLRRRVTRAIERSCSLMKLSTDRIIQHVSELCFDGYLPMRFAVDFCEEAGDANATPATATALAQAVERLVRHVANSKPSARSAKLADVVRLGRLAAAYCHNTQLADLVALYRVCEMAALVESQCDDSSYAAADSLLPTRLAVLRRQLKSAHFTEEGLVLSSEDIIPDVCRYITAVYPSSHQLKLPYLQRRVACRTALFGEHALLAKVSATAPKLFQKLSQNRQMQLGLRYAFDALSVCAQHRYLNMEVEDIRERYEHLVPAATNVVTELMSSLLGSVLCASVPDRAAAMGFIIALPLEPAFAAFKTGIASTKRQYNKLSQLALVGVGVALLWKEESFLSECTALTKNAMWWHRLSSLNVPFDRAQHEAAPEEYVRELLPAVLMHSHHDLSLTIELAESYNVPAAVACNVFVEMLCMSTEPTVLYQNANGYPELHASTQERLRQIVRLTQEPASVADILIKSCLPQLCPYHYERIHFVLELANMADRAAAEARYGSIINTGTLLLGVLKFYERSSPANNIELLAVENQLRCNRDDLNRDALRRLPFHHLIEGDHWATLKPELTLQSVKRLLPIAKLLTLSEDDFYVTVIEKLMPEMAGCTELERVSPVLDLALKISDTEAAIACTKMIADELPLSEGKVEALKLSVALANQWLENSENQPQADGKVRLVMQRLPALYTRIRTQFQLKEAGIEDQAVLDMIANPQQLIGHLLEHYSTGPQAKQLQQHNVDLMHLAKAIGNEHGVDAERLRQHLIQLWLTDLEGDDLATDADRSVMANRPAAKLTLSLATLLDDGDDSGARNAPTQAQSDVLLQKAVALLRMAETEETVCYLLTFAFEETSVKITPRARVRAYTALFMVASTPTICKFAEKTLEELREHLIALIYSTRLQESGIHQTPADFASSSKEGLVRSLWKNYSHDAKAICLVADMALDFDIFDASLWDAVLRQMLQLRLTADLQRVLVASAGIPELWCLPCLEQAWLKVIQGSVARASTGGAQSDKWTNQALDLVMQSPFVLRTQVGQLVDVCHEKKKYGMAMAAAMISSEGYEAKIAESLSGKSLMAMLDELRSSSVPLSGKIQTLVFDVIDSREAYHLALGTTHFGALVKHLISKDAINGLLTKTVTAGRLADAARLVRSYSLAHASKPAAEAVAELGEQAEDVDVLRAFAQQLQLTTVLQAL